MSLVDVAEAYDDLKVLDDRHLVIEALLIVEEYLEALLSKLIPNLATSVLLKHNKSIKFSFDQKLELLMCFFEKQHHEAFSKFPKKLQTVRNYAAHNRQYKIDKDIFKSFFDLLSPTDKENIEKITARIYKQRKETIRTFKKIDAKDQFLLLLLWFTIQVGTEIERLIEVQVLIR